MSKPISRLTRECIVYEYRRGDSIKDIKTQNKVSERTVFNVIRNANLTRCKVCAKVRRRCHR